MSVDDDIAKIKQSIEAARITKARAQAARQLAEENYETSLNMLKQDFGLDNLGQVRAKLEELQTTLEEKIAEIKVLLHDLER